MTGRWALLGALTVALTTGCGDDDTGPPSLAVQDSGATGASDAGGPATDLAPVPPDEGPVPDLQPPPPDEGPSPDLAPSTPDDGPTIDAALPLDEGPVDPTELPCDPPLGLSPLSPAVLPLDLLTFVAAGGTGQYRFELLANESDAILNPLSGAYLSGGVAPAIDTVQLTDLGCVGSVTTAIDVVTPLVVTPSAVTLDHGGALTFDLGGGTGALTLEIEPALDAEPVGSVSPDGSYTAGEVDGVDEVRVTDTGTGETVVAVVTVHGGAQLVPEPAQLAIPLGSSYAPVVHGGSGELALEVDGQAVSAANGVLYAEVAGDALVAIEDEFTGMTAQLQVAAIAPPELLLPRTGDNSASAWVLSPGDIDGDGFADGILALREADITAVDSGAVYIYRGFEGGLKPEPERILAGGDRFDRYGVSAAVGDVTGDGRVDLVVGAYTADIGVADSGAVYIYEGVDGQLFSEAPIRVLSGQFGSDQFGYSIALCDFNGDDALDLAVGVILGEDRDAQPQASNQGAVHVFLGHPAGFLDKADVTVWGKLPQGEGDELSWEYAPNLRLGNALAAGDFDGDGLCDLAAHSHQWNAGPGGNNDGIIFVYRGVGPSDLGPGGLAEDPSRVLAAGVAGDRSSQLGRILAAGDVTGDGAAELAAAQYLHETEPGKSNNPGAARLWLGGAAFGGDVAVTFDPPESAEWVFEGAKSQDQVGWSVAIQDATGDGRRDLLMGSFNHEVEGGPTNAGSTMVFAGQDGALPAAEPVWTIAGLNANDRFGQMAAVLGDLTDDGLPDLMIWAGRVDDLGVDVGRPYFVAGIGAPAPEELPPPAPLALPGEASGSQYGRSVAVVGDVDGDGLADLVIGTPLADPKSTSSGVATLHRGLAGGGFSAAPTVELSGYYGHSGSDQLGWAVAPLGDFDGDGAADFALLARSDDRPGNVATNANYAVDGGCSGAFNNGGAVLVFRGRSDGEPPAASPAFVWFGIQVGQVLDSLAGGFDIDGDGYQDFAAGSVAADRPGITNVGAFAVVRGRSADPDGKIVVICDPALTVLGLAASDALGRSVAPIGDLDGDGCDEIAAGANAEDLGKSNQGTVRVLFGWSTQAGTACAAAPRMVLLHSDDTSAQGGFSLAGGEDVDGDGVGDLAVGGHAKVVGGNSVGAAWIVPGAYLASLTPEPYEDGWLGAMHPFVDPTSAGSFRVEGHATGENLGRSVALVPGLHADGRAGLVVGGPLGDAPGVERAGGARVFRFETNPGAVGGYGLDPLPVAVLGGETSRPGGRIGEAVCAGLVSGTPLIVVGGYNGSGLGLDQGSVYVMPIEPLAP